MAKIEFKNTIIEVEGRAISSDEYMICGKLRGSMRITGEAIAGEINVEDLEVIRDDPVVVLKERGGGSCSPAGPSSSIKLIERRGKLRALVNDFAYACSEAILQYDGVNAVLALGLYPLNIVVKPLNAKVSVKPVLHTLFISLMPADI